MYNSALITAGSVPIAIGKKSRDSIRNLMRCIDACMSNKQEGNLMIHTKDKQEEQRRAIQAEREELRQSTWSFIQSLVHTGESVALLAFTKLPREPRQHFLKAGHEFTSGWTALVREFASGIEGLAKENNIPTHDGRQ
jgi:hypothetical protein